MRVEVNGMIIQYPDLAFAFNPIPLWIQRYSVANYAILRVAGIEIEKDKQIYTSDIHFDLSGVARTLFDRSEFSRVFTEDISLCQGLFFEIINPKDNSVIYMDGIPVIWGALQIGEVYTQRKSYTYFPGYPFTVPLLIRGHNYANIEASVDGSPYTEIERFSDGIKYNIDITRLNAKKKITFRLREDEDYKIFDYTFDDTFGPQQVNLYNNLDIVVNVADCPNKGYYLRWINQYGEYNYYLFQSGAESIVTKDNSIEVEFGFYSTEIERNYHIGTGKTIGKDIERSLKLFVPLVDSDTFKLLSGLIKSPIVDMFVGYDDLGDSNWINVSIQAGTFTRSNDILQDFECTLIFNKEQVQIL